MKSIWESLKIGSARDRLAIISDILSVVGVSLAVILAPLFKAPDVASAQQVLEYIQIGAVFLFILLLLTLLAMLLCSAVKTHLEPPARIMAYGMTWALWAIFVCIAIGVALNSLPK